MNMCSYYARLGFDPFEVAIPITFHIKKQQDPEYLKFVRFFNQNKNNANIWIVKPGENSNRGCGIEVANTLPEIKSLIQANAKQHGDRTSIV
jgi:tubulin---tyrosine ligase